MTDHTMTARVEQVFANHQQPKAPERRTVLKPLAEAYSKKVLMQAHAENMNSVMKYVIETYYEEADDGSYWNIGTAGLIEPVPWGRNGYKRWGVNRMYSECIRRELMRQQEQERLPCLYLFNKDRKRWHVNLTDYPTQEHAMGWLNALNLDATKAFAMYNEYIEAKKAKKYRSSAR